MMRPSATASWPRKPSRASAANRRREMRCLVRSRAAPSPRRSQSRRSDRGRCEGRRRPVRPPKALRQHRSRARRPLAAKHRLRARAGIEVEAFERAADRGFACRQGRSHGRRPLRRKPATSRRRRHSSSSQRDLIGERRVGMIDPRCITSQAVAPARAATGTASARRPAERRDRKAVVGLADKPFERRAFEHRGRQGLRQLRPRCRRENRTASRKSSGHS